MLMAELLLCASQRNTGNKLTVASPKSLALFYQWDETHFPSLDKIENFWSVLPIFFLTFSFVVTSVHRSIVATKASQCECFSW